MLNRIDMAGAERVLRVATWNIHKGVQGIGPARRLEIHNLAHAIAGLDADFICLQEVRGSNRREAERFSLWPTEPQADFLAPAGYHAVYCTNAVTRYGDHGNALLTRWPVVGHWHEDVSDHRFEQRGLLHVEVLVDGAPLHLIVAHFGLLPASRVRQAGRLVDYVNAHVPLHVPLLVAGDFNDWGTRIQRLLRLDELRTPEGPRVCTYPSRFPIAQLDHIYSRGLFPLARRAPRGRDWGRMSDHLPLLVEFGLAACDEARHDDFEGVVARAAPHILLDTASI